EEAYNYFCEEFETALKYVSGHGADMAPVEAEASEEKKLLRSVIITMAHKFALDESFANLL
ncbi:MAG: hypothetical protein Q4C51_00365, partial [Clostridia bacterium]|nr:hypothetical protein [Clostridia bacterium]